MLIIHEVLKVISFLLSVVLINMLLLLNEILVFNQFYKLIFYSSRKVLNTRSTFFKFLE